MAVIGLFVPKLWLFKDRLFLGRFFNLCKFLCNFQQIGLLVPKLWLFKDRLFLGRFFNLCNFSVNSNTIARILTVDGVVF